MLTVAVFMAYVYQIIKNSTIFVANINFKAQTTMKQQSFLLRFVVLVAAMMVPSAPLRKRPMPATRRLTRRSRSTTTPSVLPARVPPMA